MTMETELLTIKECANILNFSSRTLYVWIRQNRIPYYKIGKAIRFKRRDIFKWIAKYKESNGKN